MDGASQPLALPEADAKSIDLLLHSSGINFRDITTLLLDPKAFQDTVDLFVERYKDQKIDVVAAVEARGFIFGAPVALAIGAKFVPLRKPRKLPGSVCRQIVRSQAHDDIRMTMQVLVKLILYHFWLRNR